MRRADKKKKKEERKEKIRERYIGIDPSLLVTVPPEDKEVDVPLIQKKNLRVAAYVRVSTDDENQTSSYELQINHYKDFIAQHDGWELVGIYADEGISGTSIEHRIQFNRLIKDCEAGMIDLIVTKSISRFARNTVDSLVTQRKLSGLKNPVGVYFETENLNSLDKGNDIIMTVLSATAQEESHVKSEIMFNSLINRFNRGIFLTPELLGYDKDEDGNLVVNEDEADTAKLIYYLFLSGFSTADIAETLTALGRETKLGNTTWNRSSIVEILQNERYCGDVISWKTYTYDYLNHKTRKNRGARPRKKQENHHEAIVSHEVWEAAQKMIDNRKHSSTAQALPVLKVVNGGALRGFVPVNRTWEGFSDEDYMAASQSAYEDDDSPSKAHDEGSPFDFSGYEVVSSRLFSTVCEPALTIFEDKLKFNTACMKKFKDVEYVELLLNTVEQCLAVRPCDKDNPNAIRWGALKEDGRWMVLPKSCRGIAEPLYSIMGWNGDCGYRMSGRYFEQSGEKVILFEMDDPEIIRRVNDEQKNIENSSENGKSDAAQECVDTGSFPPKGKIIHEVSKTLETRYGDKDTEIHLLKRIECGGNWEILRPADSVDGIQEFNDNKVKAFTDMAQELIDKMRREKNEWGNGQPSDSESVAECESAAAE